MTRPRLAALALAALTLPALAGCTTAAAGSAMASRPPADEAARQWRGDAQLAGVMGLEGTFGFGGMESAAPWGQDVDWSRSGSDPRVGDGKSELWVYFYVQPGAGEGYGVVVDKQGQVVRKFQGQAPGDARPLGDWRINSDEALRLAKEANQGLRTGVESQHFGLMETLRYEAPRGRTTWSIAGGGGDSSGGGGGMVVLDAVTGEVLESRGGFGTAMP